MSLEISHHRIEYLLLIAYTALSGVLFLGYTANQTRLLILVLYAGFYFSWSIIHHLINRNLTALIILENLLLCCLALITLKVLFFPNI